MEPDRLSRSPELVAILSQAGEQSAARAACHVAVEAAGLDDARAIDALRVLTESGPALSRHETAKRMCEEFDAAAWNANDSDDYDLWFRRARAAAALSLAHEDAASEAVYEAAHAFGDVDAFEDALRDELAL